MTTKTPKLGEQLEKAAKDFDEFDANVKALTMDQMNTAPKVELEAQSDVMKISEKEKNDRGYKYLKPFRSIGCQDKFNEKFRETYNFQKEFVCFEAENHEIIGEELDIWTRPFGGMAAEEWKVPVNIPVWGPRYLAEQIKRKNYHRLIMKENQITGSDNKGNQYFGSMAADSTIQRLDARPVSQRKSVFISDKGF